MKKISLFLIFLIFSNSVFAMSILSVDISPSEIKPGDNAQIRIVFENEANSDIEDVYIKLDLSSEFLPIAPIDGGIEKFISEIENNDEEEVFFDVVISPNAPLGVYKVPLVITYTYLGEIISKGEIISLEVYVGPELDVVISEPDFLIGNMINLEFEVINKGLSNVNFLNFELEDGGFFDILSSSNNYVGDVDSDDFERVNFDILINYPVPDEIYFTVFLNYFDSSNKEHTETFVVKKKVYTLEFAKSLGLVQSDKGFAKYIFFLLSLFLVFLYWKLKKKKRKLI